MLCFGRTALLTAASRVASGRKPWADGLDWPRRQTWRHGGAAGMLMHRREKRRQEVLGKPASKERCVPRRGGSQAAGRKCCRTQQPLTGAPLPLPHASRQSFPVAYTPAWLSTGSLLRLRCSSPALWSLSGPYAEHACLPRCREIEPETGDTSQCPFSLASPLRRPRATQWPQVQGRARLDRLIHCLRLTIAIPI
jgi:hypothetical protein